MNNHADKTPDRSRPQDMVHRDTPTQSPDGRSSVSKEFGEIIADVKNIERFSSQEVELFETETGEKISVDSDGHISEETLVRWFTTPGLLEKMMATVREKFEFAQKMVTSLEGRIPKVQLKIENFFPQSMSDVFSAIEKNEKAIIDGQKIDMVAHQQLISRAERDLKAIGSIFEPVLPEKLPEILPVKRNEFQLFVNNAAAELRERVNVFNKKLALLYKNPKVAKLVDIKNSMFEKKIFLERCIFERDVLMKKNPEIFFDEISDVA